MIDWIQLPNDNYTGVADFEMALRINFFF